MVETSTNSEGAELFHEGVSKKLDARDGQQSVAVSLMSYTVIENRHVYGQDVCQIHLGPLP